MADEKLIFDFLVGKNEVSDELQQLAKQLTNSVKGVSAFSNNVSDSFKDVGSSVTKIGGGFNNFFGNMQSGFSKFGGFLKGAIGSVFSLQGAILAVVGGISFSKIISEASASEDAVNALTSSMQLNGTYTKAAANDLINFANQLQKTSKITDEAALEGLAYAQSLGATSEEAKRIAQIAANLNARLGIDFQTAIEQTTKTLSGYSGSLGKTIPEIRKMTEAQLKNGEALDFLEKKFKGGAQDSLRTFSGALTLLKNGFSDFLEALGDVIIKNPVVIALIRKLSNVISGLKDSFEQNKDAINEFISKTIIYAVKGFGYLAEAIGFVLDFLQGIQKTTGYVTKAVFELVNTFLQFELVQRILKAFANALIDVAILFNDILSYISDLASKSTILDKAFKGIGLDLKKSSESFQASTETLKKFQGEIDKFNIGEFSQNVTNGVADIVDTSTEATGKVSKFFDNLGNDILKTADDFAKAKSKVVNAFPEDQPLIDVKNPVQLFFENVSKAFNDVFNKQIFSLIGNIAQGKAGAQKIFTSLATGVADSLLPGLGQAVGPFIELFAQGPEATKKAIQEFVRAIPELIQNIILSVPAVIQALIDESPRLITELVNRLPVIIKGLADSMPLVAISLAESMPDVSIAFVNAMIDNAPQIAEAVAIAMALAIPRAIQEKLGGLDFSGVGDKIKNGLGNVGDFLKEAFKDIGSFFKDTLFEAIKDIGNQFYEIGKQFIKAIIEGISNVGGAVGGAAKSIPIVGGIVGGIGSIGKKLGFAEGGQGFVKSVPTGFLNDTFPARLTSGELVVDRSTAQRLESFLDNQGSSSATDTLLLKLIDILQSPQQVNTNIELNGRVIADVILELNRNNARLA